MFGSHIWSSLAIIRSKDKKAIEKNYLNKVEKFTEPNLKILLPLLQISWVAEARFSRNRTTARTPSMSSEVRAA
jgi:hypothetical protein